MNDFEKLVELYLGNIPTTEEEEMVVKTTIRVTPRSNRNHRKVNAQHKDAIRKRLERNGINTEDIANPEKLWKKLSNTSHNTRQYEAGRITAGKTRTAREKRQELLEGDDISMHKVYEDLEAEHEEAAREDYTKLSKLLDAKHNILKERQRLENLLVANFKAEEELNNRINAALAYWEA